MIATVSILPEGVALTLGYRHVCVVLPGVRANSKADALLILPKVFQVLKEAGATGVRLAGPKHESGMSLAEWALFLWKADAELEAARQACLQMLPVAGGTPIITIENLPKAIGADSAGQEVRDPSQSTSNDGSDGRPSKRSAKGASKSHKPTYKGSKQV